MSLLDPGGREAALPLLLLEEGHGLAAVGTGRQLRRLDEAFRVIRRADTDPAARDLLDSRSIVDPEEQIRLAGSPRGDLDEEVAGVG